MDRWVEYGRQGWVRVNGIDVDVVVLAKTAEVEGRRVIMDLLLLANGKSSSPGVDSAVLRAMPIGWLESMVNTPQARRLLAEQQGGPDPTGKAIERRATAWFFDQLQPPELNERETRLTRPDGKDPDTFYRQVAEAYTDAIAKSGTVAPLLAEEAGVPVPTVHRWIAEARRRGFLPPARRGKAG